LFYSKYLDVIDTINGFVFCLITYPELKFKSKYPLKSTGTILYLRPDSGCSSAYLYKYCNCVLPYPISVAINLGSYILLSSISALTAFICVNFSGDITMKLHSLTLSFSIYLSTIICTPVLLSFQSTPIVYIPLGIGKSNESKLYSSILGSIIFDGNTFLSVAVNSANTSRTYYSYDGN